MKPMSLSQLPDHVLLREFTTVLSDHHASTARVLAYLGEVDERKLYLPAGHPSMFAYCVHELHMSEDTAFRRIAVARASRRFPGLLPALADGRLNMTAVQLLSPHLSATNVQELIEAATHRTRSEIELLIAARFPRPDVPTLVRELITPDSSKDASPDLPDQSAGSPALARVVPSCEPNSLASMGPLLGGARDRTKLAPLSPGRFAIQVTVDQETHEQLRYAQALLGHAVPSGDVAQVLKRALNALVEQLEKDKFAKASRTRPRPGAAKGRHVPAEVRRAVWERDGGRCTFVSDKNHRCEARTRLEFDHIEPVARGGRATIANTRLRCRAHNQYGAECTYGAGFMREKREIARQRAGESVVRAAAPAPARVEAPPETRSAPVLPSDRDVIPWLRQLGFGVQEARRGAALVSHIPDASLEDRVKLALRGLAPAHRRPGLHVSGSA